MNNKKLAVCVFIVRVVCLAVPFLLVVKSLNPVSILLAMILGATLFGYIGLQTGHLFQERQKLIESDRLLAKLYKGVILITLVIFVVAAGFCVKDNSSYDRAYLDNINSRLEHKEFSGNPGEFAGFFKFCKEISLDYYGAQTIMDLVDEDASVYKEISSGNEKSYLELPNYTASNPIIIDMIYMHYGIAEDGVTEEQATGEVNRVCDMYTKVIIRSGIACATAMMSLDLVIVYLIITLFLKIAISRNTKYLEEEQENDSSKRKESEKSTSLNDSDINDDHTSDFEDSEI